MDLRIKTKLLLLFFSFLWVSGAESAVPLSKYNLLKNVSVEKNSDELIIYLEFEKNIGSYRNPTFYKKSVQMDFPFSYVKPAKKYFPTNDSQIPTVYVSQFEPKLLRVRFMLGEHDPELKKNFHLEREGRFLKVRVRRTYEDALTKLLARAAEAQEEIEDADIEAALLESQQKTEPELKPVLAKFSVKSNEKTKAVKVSAEKPRVEKPVKKEKPPLSKKTGENNSSSGFLNYQEPAVPETPNFFSASLKMFYMLALVVGLIFLVFYLFKNVLMKNTLFGGKEKLIKVLSTGFLGPKKSIAIVEIAGEILVLGIASDNISFLSKIEDEDRINDIRHSGKKNGTRLNDDTQRTVRDFAGQTAETTDSFNKHMREFSDVGTEKNSSLGDVKAMIRQGLRKAKTM